jgi:flavorubredoxin
MRQMFKAVKLTDRIYWVGAVDWAIRNFHGYATDRGTTYNAYLVIADKVTLIDTVKAPFKNELLSRIASVIEPAKIDYIISNHSEMDHSGCLPDIIGVVKPEKVFASENGVKALSDHFHGEHEILAVRDGDTLDLGNMTASFTETRMLHWPDSMFTYLAEEQALFSQDAFGMHLASTERFDDEIDDEILKYEAAKYFANILLPYSSFVTRLLDKMGKLNLPIKMVAPDHGPVWRKNIDRILNFYLTWASQKRANKAVIVYDTMWQSTAVMARVISEGLASAGSSAKVMPLGSSHRSDVATEILDAGALVVGSPTLNNTIFPTVADVLTYLKGLKPRNLIGAVFGSYGWSGEAVKQLQETLREMKVDLVADGLSVRYVPDEDALSKCFSLGALVAEKLKERCSL